MAPEGTAAENPRAVPGNNQPPTELELLQDRNKDVIERAKELADAFARVPEIIENDDVAGKAGDMVKMIATCVRTAEDRHRTEKAPHLEACRMVDGWLRSLTDPLAAARRTIENRLTAYLGAKAERERKAREAEAQRLRDEAAQRVETVATQEALAALTMVQVQSSNLVAIGYDAAKSDLHVEFKTGRFVYSGVPAEIHQALMAAQSKGQYFIQNIKGKYDSRKLDAVPAGKVDVGETMETAAALETRAAQVEASAQARPAELSRTRGDMGSVASLKRTPIYRVVDITKVPAHLLMINDAAVKAHIKTRQKDQLPAPVPGLEFDWQATASVR